MQSEGQTVELSEPCAVQGGTSEEGRIRRAATVRKLKQNYCSRHSKDVLSPTSGSQCLVPGQSEHGHTRHTMKSCQRESDTALYLRYCMTIGSWVASCCPDCSSAASIHLALDDLAPSEHASRCAWRCRIIVIISIVLPLKDTATHLTLSLRCGPSCLALRLPLAVHPQSTSVIVSCAPRESKKVVR